MAETHSAEKDAGRKEWISDREYVIHDEPHPAENAARSTHNVYRITDELGYEETPCFCPARTTHSILDTRVIPPATTTPAPDADSEAGRLEQPLCGIPHEHRHDQWVGSEWAVCTGRADSEAGK